MDNFVEKNPLKKNQQNPYNNPKQLSPSTKDLPNLTAKKMIFDNANVHVTSTRFQTSTMSMDFAKRIPPQAHYIITHTFGIRGTRAVKSRTRYPRMTWVWHGCRRTIRFFSFPLIGPFTCAFFSRIVSQRDVFVLAALGNLRARNAAEGARHS